MSRLTEAQVRTIVQALPEPLARALVESREGQLVVGGMRAGMLDMLERMQRRLDAWPAPGESTDLPIVLGDWIADMRARVEAIDPEGTLPGCRAGDSP